jgi:hypothetical protein
VLRLTRARHGDTSARAWPGRAVLASATCFLRSLPLFVAAVPRTPLRVLCIIALDTLHVLRYSKALSRRTRQDLAAFLDFQACTNAAWDRKDPCTAARQAIRQRLGRAGLEPWIEMYLGRLQELEAHRPSIGGDRQRFDEVRAYREAVVRLSLATIGAIALHAERLEPAIQATHGVGDMAMLFRMSMQCQIIDDVLDYRMDLSLGLPSFLTASASLPQAIDLTARAARSYGEMSAGTSSHGALPLHLALRVITTMAIAVIQATRWRLAVSRWWRSAPSPGREAGAASPPQGAFVSFTRRSKRLKT